MFLPFSRHHLRYDHCLEDKREYYKNCSLLFYVGQLCTMICTHIQQFSMMSVGLGLGLVVVHLGLAFVFFLI